MNNILKERLSEAITSKKNDITTYVWKGKKREVNGVFVQEENKNNETQQKSKILFVFMNR